MVKFSRSFKINATWSVLSLSIFVSSSLAVDSSIQEHDVTPTRQRLSEVTSPRSAGLTPENQNEEIASSPDTTRFSMGYCAQEAQSASQSPERAPKTLPATEAQSSPQSPERAHKKLATTRESILAKFAQTVPAHCEILHDVTEEEFSYIKRIMSQKGPNSGGFVCVLSPMMMPNGLYRITKIAMRMPLSFRR